MSSEGSTRGSQAGSPTIRDSFQLPNEDRSVLGGAASTRASDASAIVEGVAVVDEAEPSGPCSWADREGNVYYYRNKPLLQVCPFILMQECCERLAYYGIMPTLKPFLKTKLGIGDAQASSYVEYYAALIYIPPIFSATLADTFTGVYRTVLIFSVIYALGLGLLVCAANDAIGAAWMVYVSLFVLIVIGAGGIKSCINVFGGQQFHPEQHEAGIKTFFSYFYASINVGSIVGGLVVPQLSVSVSYFVAYLIPLGAFMVASAVFVIGKSRYVKMKPQGSPVVAVLKVLFRAAQKRSFQKAKASNGGPCDTELVEDTLGLLKLLPIVSMVIPLLIAYNQMTTAFLTQGEKMKSTIFGIEFTPSLMQNIDPIGVVLATIVADMLIFPRLQKVGLMPNVMTKFCIGNIFGVAALLCAYGVERAVMAQDKPNTLSIWWQLPQFALIATAEIFSISTSYEVAFTLAPSSLKTVSSACNLIFFSIAGFISGLLFVFCEGWMPDYKASEPSTYKDSHYDYYYLVLAGVCVVGGLVCLAMRPYFRWATTKRRTKGAEDVLDENALLENRAPTPETRSSGRSTTEQM